MSEVINLNDSSPAAPAGKRNVAWQKGAQTGTDPATGLGIFPVSGNVDAGDVLGPASAASGDFAQYDGTTGKLIKDGGLSLTTDGTLAANSDLLIPSEKAVKTYVASATAAPSGTANKVYATPNGGSGSASLRALVAADLPAGVDGARTIGLVIDGGGSVPATGAKGFIQIPWACTITGWTMLGDASGSAQITVKKSTYAGFPTQASIVASAPPNLSAAQKNTSTTLTGWTTAIAAGDVLGFNLDSITTCNRVTLTLQVTRT